MIVEANLKTMALRVSQSKANRTGHQRVGNRERLPGDKLGEYDPTDYRRALEISYRFIFWPRIH